MAFLYFYSYLVIICNCLYVDMLSEKLNVIYNIIIFIFI